jgi:DNA-directed RNA polymerase specialized sigma24 family protein
LLANNTINNILLLQEKGFSVRKIAELADVSVSTIQRIANGTRTLNHSEPVRDDNSTDSTALDLHGKTYQRYLTVHDQVESEILNGKRTPLSAIVGNF